MISQRVKSVKTLAVTSLIVCFFAIYGAESFASKSDQPHGCNDGYFTRELDSAMPGFRPSSS